MPKFYKKFILRKDFSKKLNFRKIIIKCYFIYYLFNYCSLKDEKREFSRNFSTKFLRVNRFFFIKKFVIWMSFEVPKGLVEIYYKYVMGV